MGKLIKNFNTLNPDSLVVGKEYKIYFEKESDTYSYLGKRYVYWPIVTIINDQKVKLKYSIEPEPIYFFESRSYSSNFIGYREKEIAKLKHIENIESLDKMLYLTTWHSLIDSQEKWIYTKKVIENDSIVTKTSNDEIEITCNCPGENINIFDLFDLDFVKSEQVYDFSSFFYFFSDYDEAESNQTLFMDADCIIKMLEN